MLSFLEPASPYLPEQSSVSSLHHIQIYCIQLSMLAQQYSSKHSNRKLKCQTHLQI